MGRIRAMAIKVKVCSFVAEGKKVRAYFFGLDLLDSCNSYFSNYI